MAFDKLLLHTTINSVSTKTEQKVFVFLHSVFEVFTWQTCLTIFANKIMLFCSKLLNNLGIYLFCF